MGGQVESEDWMIDNFNSDPNVGLRMIETAENVAKDGGFTKEQCDDLAYRRYEQYLQSLARDREFQLRYMFPSEVSVSKKEKKLVAEDEGVVPTSREALTRLKPVLPDGVMSFGAQTHPADGNCGIVVTTKDRAKELSQDRKIGIQIISYGYARAKAGYMAMAPVPAAEMAIRNAGLRVQELKAVKTHNPFIVNDLWFAQQMNIEAASFNNYGCSMVYGHPQAPTAARAIIEGIEEVVALGGGYLLWAGCAAGDTGAAIVLKIA
jgi:acetyl-CoA acetyltransferase